MDWQPSFISCVTAFSIEVRTRTVLRVAVWGALLGYVTFVIAFAVSNYFEMVALVESAVQKPVEGERWMLARQADAPVGDHVEEVREAILRGAERGGLPVDERKLVVSQAGTTLRVSLHWSYPVIRIGGEAVVVIPLALDRSFEMRP